MKLEKFYHTAKLAGEHVVILSDHKKGKFFLIDKDWGYGHNQDKDRYGFFHKHQNIWYHIEKETKKFICECGKVIPEGYKMIWMLYDAEL